MPTIYKVSDLKRLFTMCQTLLPLCYTTHMEDNKILKIVYTFFLGLLLAIFVGVGINTFYEAPTTPKYPTELTQPTKERGPEQTAEQQAFDQKMDEYNDKSRTYNRNVSIMTLIAAVAFLTVSLLSEKKIRVIADGIMIGGLFTLLYSLGRGFASEDSKYTFIAVTIGLITALYLGYHRFVRQNQTVSTHKKVRAS